MNLIRNLLDRLRHPGEGPDQRARRRYVEALGRQGPFMARSYAPAPKLHTTHIVCGTAHLSWEWCPVLGPQTLRIGRVIPPSPPTDGLDEPFFVDEEGKDIFGDYPAYVAPHPPIGVRMATFDRTKR